MHGTMSSSSPINVVWESEDQPSEHAQLAVGGAGAEEEKSDASEPATVPEGAEREGEHPDVPENSAEAQKQKQQEDKDLRRQRRQERRAKREALAILREERRRRKKNMEPRIFIPKWSFDVCGVLDGGAGETLGAAGGSNFARIPRMGGSRSGGADATAGRAIPGGRHSAEDPTGGAATSTSLGASGPGARSSSKAGSAPKSSSIPAPDRQPGSAQERRRLQQRHTSSDGRHGGGANERLQGLKNSHSGFFPPGRLQQAEQQVQFEQDPLAAATWHGSGPGRTPLEDLWAGAGGPPS